MKKIYILIAAMFFAGGVFAQCSITLTNTNVSCYGGSDGSATVTPTGSTPPYSYFWSPGGQTTANVNSLTVGSYSATVTDANSCVATTVVTITGPPQFNITLTTTNISSSTSCDGSISASVSGGTPPYTYMWQPGGLTGSPISNQCAGTYYFQVTDSLSCVKSDTTNLVALCSVTFTTTNLTCYELSNGTATLIPTGGTPGYSYLWSPGGQTNASVSSLSAGSYTATATDANSCVATTVVTITEPPQFSIILTTTNLSDSTSCDGSISASVSGGTPPYTYLWLPGGLTTSTITSQCAGTYYFNVTDSHGCTKSDTANSIGVTGLKEIFSANMVTVYPNPSTGQFSILFNKQISDAKISVTNILGQEVFLSAITNLKMEIDITQQPKGIYFVQVLNEKTVLTSKLIKE